jgi:tetratricopeptide (TPR) repeat protein
LAASYLNLEQYEESVNALKKTIKLDPDFSAYKNLGVVYIALGKFRAAADAFAKAIELNPPSTYRYLGYSYQKLGKNCTHAKPISLACSFNQTMQKHAISSVSWLSASGIEPKPSSR